MKNSMLSSCALVPRFGIFADAASGEAIVNKLKQDIVGLAEACQTILDSADADNGRDLTDDELTAIAGNKDKMGNLQKQVEAREAVLKASIGQGRKSSPSAPITVKPNPMGGFKSFGEFANCVRTGSLQPQNADGRLLAVQTTFGNEASGADGGWAVPPTFRTEIWRKVMEEENLLARCTPLTTAANSITIPKDETTPWGTAGIRVYWEAEGNQATASKPALEYSTMRLNKLMALVPISDENLDDAPGLESWLLAIAPGRMAAKINTAIVSGTGAGQPLGILRAPCTIVINKETSQPADSIMSNNIHKMWARMYAPCRRNSIWLINQDIEPQLDGMSFPGGLSPANGAIPLYIPPGGLSAAPYASLKGRPVVPLEACQTLGDKGDIILADMTQYWALTKGSGVQSDVSIHLYFDQGLTAFRFTFRVNGQPIWNAPVTPENGPNTRSCFVTLNDRP